MLRGNGAKGNGELPEGAGRLLKLVERSAPDPKRPRLPAEYEEQLAVVDAKSAAAYASMEDLSDRCVRLAKRIEGDEGVVMNELEGDESLVAHISSISDEITTSRAAAASNGRLKR